VTETPDSASPPPEPPEPRSEDAGAPDASAEPAGPETPVEAPGDAADREPLSEAPGAPATPEPPPPPRRSLRRAVRDYFETVLVAILIVLFATTFIVQNSVIPSASMEDTLLVGDYILVNRIAFAPEDARAPAGWLGMREVRHADIVVFKYPDDPETDYIKRVIGLPGDVIEVRDKLLLRGGVVVREPWAVHRSGIVHPRESRDGARDNFGPVRVPPGMLFVMGDNRDYSRDSREFGFVPRSNVTGRALLVFWSRSSAPGAFRRRGPALGRMLASLRSFHRDVRWGRILTVVR
jgi:signal peptidase I